MLGMRHIPYFTPPRAILPSISAALSSSLPVKPSALIALATRAGSPSVHWGSLIEATQRTPATRPRISRLETVHVFAVDDELIFAWKNRPVSRTFMLLKPAVI